MRDRLDAAEDAATARHAELVEALHRNRRTWFRRVTSATPTGGSR
jgi:hypothetical protein